MAGRLPNHYNTAFHGYSSLADETALLYTSMVSCPRVALCCSMCIRCHSSCALDLHEWWTSVTYCSGNSSMVQITA